MKMKTKTQNRLRTSANGGKGKRGDAKAATLKLRRILVPLDFSGNSFQALESAIPLARHYGAKINLLHSVVHPVCPDGAGNLTIDVETPAKVARARLKEMVARLLPDGMPGQTFVRYGSARDNICWTAETLKADLIVLTTHGRSGLSRALLRSTAERVIRHAPCSVLTVRRRTGSPSADKLKAESDCLRRILVPLDFSLTSLRALDVAARLAQDNDAGLLLVHVVEATPYATGMDGAALAVPDSVLAERAEANLPKLARRFVPASVSVATLVARGRAAKVIVQTARAMNIDLIVLATHGRTGLERFLMGSTAEKVVRHARCPVFVVRRLHRKRRRQRGELNHGNLFREN